MTKVLSLMLAIIFIGTLAGAAEAGRCDPRHGRDRVTVYPFCREQPSYPHLQLQLRMGRGHRHGPGCGHPGYGQRYPQPMPVVMPGPQCNPCMEGFARSPIPGKPCWCEPIQ